MRPILLPLLLLCAAPSSARPAPADPLAANVQSPDERQVLAAVDGFFTAVHDKDRAALLATVLPEGLATAIRVGEGPQPPVRSWHWATYIENQIANPQIFTERLMPTPRVLVERDIAMVWARYELLVDGAFDHCGVDHFDMVRRDGRWLVYNLTWTNQKSGCPGR